MRSLHLWVQRSNLLWRRAQGLHPANLVPRWRSRNRANGLVKRATKWPRPGGGSGVRWPAWRRTAACRLAKRWRRSKGAAGGGPGGAIITEQEFGEQAHGNGAVGNGADVGREEVAGHGKERLQIGDGNIDVGSAGIGEGGAGGAHKRAAVVHHDPGDEDVFAIYSQHLGLGEGEPARGFESLIDESEAGGDARIRRQAGDRIETGSQAPRRIDTVRAAIDD